MLMDNDTIVTLYREAVENGDPKEIINSMAKTNGCSPGEIRQILNDAGEFVPRQKRGRPKAAGNEPERQLPLPDAVKRCIMKGLDDIEKEIKKKQEELAILEAEYNTITEYMKT